jgi:DNA-binding transcriptional regulator YdaS (Cro superfamily)
MQCFTVYVMPKRKERDIALQLAIEAAGGVVALAKLLGLNKQAVSQWRKCPPKRVRAVEAATGGVVTRYRLRPDIYGRA